MTDIEGTLFAYGHAGFMVVDSIGDGEGESGTAGGEKAVLHVIETGYEAPVFSLEIGQY